MLFEDFCRQSLNQINIFKILQIDDLLRKLDGQQMIKSSDLSFGYSFVISYKLLFITEKIFTFYLFTSLYFPIFSYRALLLKETNLV